MRVCEARSLLPAPADAAAAQQHGQAQKSEVADVREESLDPVHRAAHCLCLPGPQLQGTDVKTDPMLLHCPKSVHGAMDWAEAALLAHTCQCGLLRRLPVPQCCRPGPHDPEVRIHREDRILAWKKFFSQVMVPG